MAGNLSRETGRSKMRRDGCWDDWRWNGATVFGHGVRDPRLSRLTIDPLELTISFTSPGIVLTSCVSSMTRGFFATSPPAIEAGGVGTAGALGSFSTSFSFSM